MPAPRLETVLRRLRRICLALPDTKETLTWGQPHFRVGDRILAGFGEEKGRTVIGFKVTSDHQDALIMQDRFRVAPYVGRFGWVSMDATGIEDWDELREFIHESYQLIAPKRSLAKLTGSGATPRRSRNSASHRKPASGQSPNKKR